MGDDYSIDKFWALFRERCRFLRISSYQMGPHGTLATARITRVNRVRWRQSPGCLRRESPDEAEEAGRPISNRDRNQVRPVRRVGTALATHSTRNPIPTSQLCFHCLERTTGNGETSTSAVALPLPPTPPSWMKPDCEGRSA